MKTLSLLIGLSWITFWIYWIVSAANMKENLRGDRARSRWFRLIFLIVIIVILFGHSSRNIHLGYVISDHRPWLKIASALLIYVGLALAIWARRHIGRNWGLPMAVKKDPQLVTSGPYALIRHPIYTGIILAAFGTIFVQSVSWLLVFLLFGSYFIYSSFKEDQQMAKQFSKTYPAYKARTKMLIPYIF